jgi:hypothetical protein
MFKDCTAAELAGLLETAAKEPQYTGGLSMLDEATMAFGRLSSEIAAAHQRFAEARLDHMHRHRSPTPEVLEEEVVRAANALAVLLRPLGDVRVARCKREAGWGTCNLPLDDDGMCRSSLGHADDEA